MDDNDDHSKNTAAYADQLLLQVLICGSGEDGEIGFRRRPKSLISQDCPAASSHHHAPTNNPVGQHLVLFSLRPCVLHHRRRRCLFSSSFYAKFIIFPVGIRLYPERGCPADHCALSREGASKRTLHLTRQLRIHSHTAGRQANWLAEPIHSPTRSQPSFRTLLSRHTSRVASSTALFVRGA